MSFRLRVTHPFHPLSGQELVWISERSSRHGDRVWYERPDGSVASIPKAWTDLATRDRFVAQAAGRARLHPQRLSELVALVDAIRGHASRKEEDDV